MPRRKTGAKVLKIVGTMTSWPANRTGGEDVILVGDVSSLKGTKGDAGADGVPGPAWAPTVETDVELNLSTPIGVIAVEVSEGVTGYLPVYPAATGG